MGDCNLASDASVKEVTPSSEKPGLNLCDITEQQSDQSWSSNIPVISNIVDFGESIGSKAAEMFNTPKAGTVLGVTEMIGGTLLMAKGFRPAGGAFLAGGGVTTGLNVSELSHELERSSPYPNDR